MVELTQKPLPSWGRAAWCGAETGIALALLYALAFIGYAVIRATLALLATPDPDGGLVGTVLATWLALALPALAFAAIFALPVAAVGALTALLLRGLVARASTPQTPGRALAAGGALCLVLSLALLTVLWGGLGVSWTSATAGALAFWLITPMILYLATGSMASWHVCRLRRRSGATL